MAKKYILKLTAEEREELTRLVRKGNVAGWKVQRAQALLKCDQVNKPLTNELSTNGPAGAGPAQVRPGA